MNKLHKTSTELIVCGDFNVYYFNDNSRKLLLDSFFASYSLFSAVNFHTRNFNNSSSLIDNIYINTYTHDFSVQPFINGLSDHDAQTITLNNILNPIPKQALSLNRKFDSNSTNNFAFMLSFENWQDVFLGEDVNLIFNNFLNYLSCNDQGKLDLALNIEESDKGENSEMPTYEEIEESIAKLKNGRAPGEDNIIPEMIKYGGKQLVKKLHELTCAIWREEKMSKIGKLVLSAPYSKKAINLTATTIDWI